MILDSIHASVLSIPFKVAFKHASAERTATQTLWVEARARDGTTGHGEGCPREYVTIESLASAQEFVATYQGDWLKNICDVHTLSDWAVRHRTEIDANPAAWTAVELALLDLLGKQQGRSVEALLGLPELAGCFRYTAVLGDASPRQFEVQLAQYLKAGFHDFKIKLSGELERDVTKVRALTAGGIAPHVVRADANNLWADSTVACAYFERLGYPFFALEEPLHTGNYDGMQHLAATLKANIILDESLLRIDQLTRLGDTNQYWIVNLRISKMGGLLRSMELVRMVRQFGLRMIIGAHVGETSLLTRAALAVANSERDILLAQEGAFGNHLLERDVVDPPLMFGPGGVLDADAAGISRNAGFGLAPSL